MGSTHAINLLQTNFYFTYFTFWGFYFSAGYFVWKKLQYEKHQGMRKIVCRTDRQATAFLDNEA